MISKRFGKNTILCPQITVSEQTVMRTFQAMHLSAQDMAKIAALYDGKFDDTVLYRLLTALATSLAASLATSFSWRAYRESNR
jgi:hypothetical protein